MKSLCIIGAGPAGLVAAKTFLQTGAFEVTVYEKSSRLGGIWALDEDSRGSYLSPRTPTNLSRFTVGFSDLAWDSVDARSNGENGEGKAPMFPKAWQVNRYLQAYRRKYVPEEAIVFCTEVVRTVPVEGDAGDGSRSWSITTRQDGGEDTKVFDHVIVATGFFSRARPLGQNVAVENEPLPVKAIHSSHFRSLEDLFPSESSPAGKNILLIGGGNSAGEAAAAMASQLSDSQWSPNTSSKKRYEGCKILHVTPRPIYALPPFTPSGEGEMSFMPIDFNFYNLARRLPGPITGNGGRVPKTVKDMLHGALRTSIGGDQSDLGAGALVAPEGDERGTVQVALSETYAEFVRSGLIEVLPGRVKSLRSGEESCTAAVRHDDQESELAGIGAVVYCTGYSPGPALSMFDDTTKDALHFDEHSMRLPLILEQWQTMSDRCSNLAFIGFYEGPYWPVMEMQARLTATRWLDSNKFARKSFEEVEKLLELRQAMQARELDVPQYWFGDYAGYMEELATELNLHRNDLHFKGREGSVSPARYLTSVDDKQQADTSMADMHHIWQACLEHGKFVPRAAFRALQGHWTIHRRITSSKGNLPSGTLTGTASFHPRQPTSDRSGKTFDCEYIYVESGTFMTTEGFTMTASRRYVYRYSEAEDKLSVWFVKAEKDLEVDYLFHDLTFVSPEEAKKEGAHVAKANHLCAEDMYWTEYRMPVKGIGLRTFEVRHTVKGPKKDYVTVTRYERPKKGE